MTHELKTGGDRGYLRIATEEAFATQEQFDAIMRLVKEGRADKGTMSLWGFYGTSASERTTFIRERLLDVGPLRLQAMDEAGIDKAVLALTSPGTQSLFDAEEAKGVARRANELRIHLNQLLSNQPVEILAGNRVLEIRPYGVHKGRIIPPMSAEREARTTIVAIGDDRTDEDLFAALPPNAISARVGPGATRARFRLDGTSAVRRVLQMVADTGVRADLA